MDEAEFTQVIELLLAGRERGRKRDQALKQAMVGERGDYIELARECKASKENQKKMARQIKSCRERVGKLDERIKAEVEGA